MTPYELKNATATQLRLAREAMLDWQYLMALEKLSAAEQRRAALQLTEIQRAYLRLRATKLADIRESLVENEDALTAGIKSLERALRKVTKAEGVVRGAAELLKAVKRVV